MDVSDYAPEAEVRRACRDLGIGDWTEKTDEHVDEEEARAILEAIDTGELDVPLDRFAAGLGVELEHGIRYPDANVTNNHPVLTGKIVLAHLRESLEYYERLAVAEAEAELLSAIARGDADAVREAYAGVLDARRALDRVVAQALAG